MSARDDYPLGRLDLGAMGVHYTVEPGVWHDLCDEIDQLRANAQRWCPECGGEGCVACDFRSVS